VHLFGFIIRIWAIKRNFGSYFMLHVVHVSALQGRHQVPVFSKTYLENLTNLHVPKNFVVLYMYIYNFSSTVL
jgi:hypothetical protein